MTERCLDGEVMMMKSNKTLIIEFKKELKEAEKWANFVGYKEDDVSDIIKSVRKNKRKKKL